MQSINQTAQDTFVRNQIQKSIFSILQQRDLFDLMTNSQIETTVQQIESAVEEIYSGQQQIIQDGNLNQGVSVISQQVQQMNLILGKNLDGLIATVSRRIESAGKGRLR